LKNYLSTRRKGIVRQKKYNIEDIVQKRLNSEIKLPRNAIEFISQRNLGPENLWLPDPKLKAPSASKISNEQMLSIFSNISTPIHVILGSQSPFYTRLTQGIEQIQKKLEITFNVIHSGHYAHCELPEAVSSQILKLTT